MKKNLLALLLVLTMIAVSACSASPAPTATTAPAPTAAATDTTASAATDSIGTWSLTIVTLDGEKTFTNADATALTPVTLDATIKNKKGETSTAKYTGVKLSDVLTAVGVTEFTSLTITASDDFSAEYTKELALKEDTIVAWAKDGKLMDGDHPVQMAPVSGTGNQFVKNVAKVSVTK